MVNADRFCHAHCIKMILAKVKEYIFLTGNLVDWVVSLTGSESNQTQEDVYVASVETDRGVREQLRLYDTRGLHDGVDLPKHYFSVADGFVLVYSVDSLESFKKVDALKKEIDKSRDKKEVYIIEMHYVVLCSMNLILRYPQV